MTNPTKEQPIWLTEGDEKEFEYKGLKCFIFRHKDGPGHLCGYVEVPADHPWYKKGYSNLYEHTNVHGDLSYADSLGGKFGDDKWFLGFDCAHAGDLLPYSGRESNLFRVLTDFIDTVKAEGEMPSGDTYKDMTFVEAEIKQLADQILAFKS